MTALYHGSALRQIEAACLGQPLMRRAGAAAAAWAEELDEGRLPVLVLAGPGNNGGDAFEAASFLREHFFDVHLVFAGNPARLPADARAAHARFTGAGGVCLAEIPDLPRWGLIVDGIFGMGLARAPAARHAEWITTANALSRRDACPLLALDCPSGLDADTGDCPGTAILASHTLTFIAPKPGLYTGEGPDHCGMLRLADLGLSADALAPPSGALVCRSAFSPFLRHRRSNSHKGTFGSVGVLGGAHSMLGAVFLAGRAAINLGAGKVFLGLLDPHAPSIDPIQPELMLRKPEGVIEAGLDALACGPGLGNSLQANALLDRVLGLPIPLVLDADALNLLAFEPALQTNLAARRSPTLLTPHPAEAARLLDCDPEEIQSDRIAAAIAIARRFDSLVALKGCGTILADPKGEWSINTTGNPGLATAGTGDVLTGILLALLAQSWPAQAALSAAVHLHGAAADALVANGIGPVGLTAGEIINAARTVFNAWLHSNANTAHENV